MDKKNTFIGILFLVAAFAMVPLMNKQNQTAPGTDDQPAPQPSQYAPGQQPPAQAPPDLAPSIEAGPQQVAEVIENTIESVPATEVVPEELTCLESDKIEVIFHVEALYGILFFYLFLIGGGQWAISRKRVQPGQSVLESEQSIFSGEARPSIFNGDGDVILTPPVDSEEEISNDEATENSEEEDKGS